MFELLLLVFAAAFGFAAAGSISALLQWLTNRPVVFAVPEGGAIGYLVAALKFMLAGPYIVVQASFRARFVDQKSWGVLGGGITIAAIWSICTGILLIDLMLRLGALG
jgi:hypothetical protein